MARDGRQVLLPLLDRPIPLILDEWAKPELGSGCVKITPAHDPNDYDVWERHRDEIGIINILNPDGTLNEAARPLRRARPLRGPQAVVRRPQGPAACSKRSRTARSRSATATAPRRRSSPTCPTVVRAHGRRAGRHHLRRRDAKEAFEARGLAQAAIDAIGAGIRSPSGSG